MQAGAPSVVRIMIKVPGGSRQQLLQLHTSGFDRLKMEAMTVEPDDEHGHGEWEIICEPGVHTGWVLYLGEALPANEEADVTTRSYVSTLLELEEAIADRVAAFGDSVARVVHTFGARDVHLRNGSRIRIRWEPVVADWRCLDCGVDTDAIDEYYMVLDPIWESATDGGADGHLCIECLERRLGRALRASDFSALEVNTNSRMPRSPRLADRLRDQDAAQAPPSTPGA